MIRSRIFARLACFALSMALSSAAFAQAIVVGAKEFTEQLLVAEMTTQLLQANGFAAHKGTGFATTGIRSLQESGIIDLYWEYTGTSLSEFNQIKEKLSPDEGFASVKALDAKRGLAWLAPSKVNNTYALAVRRGGGLGEGGRGGAAGGCSRKGNEVDLGSGDEAARRRGNEAGLDRRIPDARRWLEAASAGLWVRVHVGERGCDGTRRRLRRASPERFRRRRGLLHGRAHLSHQLDHSGG